MARLEKDHVRIARVLENLERVLLTDDESDINWEIVADIISYLQEYPDAVHHPVEDQLFDRVLDKGLTPAERELVHNNLAQHAQIIGATAELARDIQQILNDIVVPVPQLQAHLQDYLTLQRAHMRNEVQHLFPLAERQLGADDWQDIALQTAAHADPLFEQDLDKFAALYRFITQGVD
jgi:hemerythrin-like domain-containing protein